MALLSSSFSYKVMTFLKLGESNKQSLYSSGGSPILMELCVDDCTGREQDNLPVNFGRWDWRLVNSSSPVPFLALSESLGIAIDVTLAVAPEKQINLLHPKWRDIEHSNKWMNESVSKLINVSACTGLTFQPFSPRLTGPTQLWPGSWK